MNQLDIVEELGEDVILLTRPDSWLEQKERNVSQQLSILCEEKSALTKAIQVKRRLQEKNLVAVQHGGSHTEEDIIEIIPLPDAIRILSQEAEDNDCSSHSSQLNVWRSDGYDVETASTLRG